jgi:hypothetical protein
MVNALVSVTEDPAQGVRILDVPGIRSRGDALGQEAAQLSNARWADAFSPGMSGSGSIWNLSGLHVFWIRATLENMPKRTSKPRLDAVQNARRVVDVRIEESEVSLSIVSQVMSQMGRKGGKIGGKRRLETLSDERRSEIASLAAKKRWAAKKKPNK